MTGSVSGSSSGLESASIDDATDRPVQSHVGVANLANGLTVARLLMVPLFVSLIFTHMLTPRATENGGRLVEREAV